MRGYAFGDIAGDFAPMWRKSSWSWGNGNCVEVAGFQGNVVGVRDSKNPEGDVLRFTRTEWNDFVKGVRSAE